MKQFVTYIYLLTLATVSIPQYSIYTSQVTTSVTTKTKQAVKQLLINTDACGKILQCFNQFLFAIRDIYPVSHGNREI